LNRASKSPKISPVCAWQSISKMTSRESTVSISTRSSARSSLR